MRGAGTESYAALSTHPLAQKIIRRGAEDGIRTCDLLVTSELLYQLSYFGMYNRSDYIILPLRSGVA